MLAGAAISAMGAIKQAEASKAAASYNAQLRERDAGVALQQADRDAEQVRLAGRRTEGSLLAGYGASGVTLEGSPLDVLAMSASQAKYDEETVLYKGRLKASGYDTSAVLERFGGQTAMEQGKLNASSYLISGVAQAGGYTAKYDSGSSSNPNAMKDAEAEQARARKRYGTD
jgi:hypothetical protein